MNPSQICPPPRPRRPRSGRLRALVAALSIIGAALAPFGCAAAGLDPTGANDRPEGPKLRPGTAGSAPGNLQQSSGALHEGDRIQLLFIERLDVDEDRWRGSGSRGAVPRSFHQRTELSGEYVVQEDGTIALPLLGRFNADSRDQDALVAELTTAFEALVERKGFVSVAGIERQPIYVVGQVKTPGPYKYRAGMTVLHAVALAGGMKQVEMDPWRRVEYGREVEHLQKALDKVRRLLTRTTVLQAERDGKPVAQRDLVSFVGRREAVPLVGEEAWQRTLTSMNHSTQEASLTLQVNNAQSELAARQARVTPVDAALDMRRERVKNITQLVDRNVVSRAVLLQAQTELSDALDRRQQTVLEVEAAKKRLAQAEGELGKFKVETGVEINRAASAAERETLDAVGESEGSLQIVRTLAATQGAAYDESAVRYEVARRTSKGTVVLALPETAPLEPGDLVRLRTEDKRALEQPGANVESGHRVLARNDKNAVDKSKTP